MEDIDDLKKKCIARICDLKKDQRLEVLEFLVINIDKYMIQQQQDGCRINLDLVPDNIIRSLYGLIAYKMK